MKLQRFDFGGLHDFRRPITVNPAVTEHVVAEAPPPPPPPSFSTQELEDAKAAARKLGYAEGFEAGLQQANTEAAQREKDTAASVQKIADQFERLVWRYQHLIDHQSTELAELVTMIARKVADVALDANGADAITATVGRCLPVIFGKPKVTVELHPDMLDAASPMILAKLSQGGYSGDVHFKSNAAFGKHDVKLDWGNGQASRSTESLWLEIEALLHQVSLTPHLASIPEPKKP